LAQGPQRSPLHGPRMLTAHMRDQRAEIPESRIHYPRRSVSPGALLSLSALVPTEVCDVSVHSSDAPLLDFSAAVGTDTCIRSIWPGDHELSTDFCVVHRRFTLGRGCTRSLTRSVPGGLHTPIVYDAEIAETLRVDAGPGPSLKILYRGLRHTESAACSEGVRRGAGWRRRRRVEQVLCMQSAL
jgi:hypothetical protein